MDNINISLRFLWSASASLTFFWILNILKESFGEVKGFLNFYPPIGPLLGLFIFSILIFILTLFVLKPVNLSNQKTAFWAMLISAILFLIMVFPPVFEPVVNLLR